MPPRQVNQLRSLPKKNAVFVEPMECLSVSKLPEGLQWLWEVKLDGYRALAVKSGSDVTLFSRRRKSLNRKFPYTVAPLADMPEGRVVDGELVGLDDNGRPDFNLHLIWDDISRLYDPMYARYQYFLKRHKLMEEFLDEDSKGSR